jgi:hypothetical protein
MFEYEVDILNNGWVRKFRLIRHAERLCYSDVLDLWQRDEPFRSFFISLLAEAPFSAYRWETPPVSCGTVNREFEFVLLDSPYLARHPDTTAFASHFNSKESGAGVVVFNNLGNDAVLVVPTPQARCSAYTHLAAFTRSGPASQTHALWQIVGRTMQARITERPLWLNTAGGGVSWVHIRLDCRPKYYGFRPYRESS